MVIKEYYKTRADGVSLYRYYSDNGKVLVQSQTGTEYAEAIDPENSTYTYTEGDDIELTALEALKIITGGGGNDDQS